jgi:two-component system, sensor histidine kinase YesM
VNTGKRFRLADTLERVYDRISSIRISRKLALLYVAAVIVCMLALSAFYYLMVSDYIKDQTSELLGHTLKQAKNNIEYKISLYNKFTYSIYTNRKLQETLSGAYTDPLSKFDVRELVFGQMDLAYKSYDDINTINLYVTNLSLPTSKSLTITVNSCTEAELEKYLGNSIDVTKWVFDTPEQVKEGKTFIPLIFDDTSNTRVTEYLQTGQLYALLKLRYHAFNTDLGFIKLDFNINRFFGGINTVGLEDKGWIDITDANFHPVYSGLDPAKQQDVPKIDWKGQRELFSSPEQSVIFKNGNMSYIMVYDVLKDTGWKIIYTLPLDDYLSTVNKLRWVTVLAFILCIVIFTALSGFIASRFTKKIRELSHSMKKIQIGDFDVHISYRGHDEVGHLINGFNIMAGKLKELVDEVYVIQVKEKEAEMKALQAQINPHFLYNTLASISWLGMRNGVKDITKISNSLAKFYKVSLSKGRNIIKVGDELEHVKAYMDIQDIRYKNKIRLAYDIDEELLEVPTIKLIVQPFIENAIIHGIWGEKETINIRLIVKRQEEMIVWRIIDDGVGISRGRQQEMEQTDQFAAGYGVINVDQRIKLYFGDRYGVSMFSREGIGTVIEIVTPYDYTNEKSC